MAPARRRSVAASTFINKCLHGFNEAELKDVIRVAQRLLKAKESTGGSEVDWTVFELLKGSARAPMHVDWEIFELLSPKTGATGAKRRLRFWDRPLELDWGADGVPKIQYPRRESKGGSEVDWKVFDLLKGSAHEPMQVDWEIFELLSPRKYKKEEVSWDIFQLLAPAQELAEPEAEPDTIDFSAVDWSGNRLPHLKANSSPPSRRPGRPGRVRTGRYHRAIEPCRRKGSEMGFEAPPVSASPLAAKARQPAFSVKKVSQLRSPWVSRRMNVRIQQP